LLLCGQGRDPETIADAIDSKSHLQFCHHSSEERTRHDFGYRVIWEPLGLSFTYIPVGRSTHTSRLKASPGSIYDAQVLRNKRPFVHHLAQRLPAQFPGGNIRIQAITISLLNLSPHRSSACFWTPYGPNKHPKSSLCSNYPILRI